MTGFASLNPSYALQAPNMTTVTNLFADIPRHLPQEQIDELAASPNVRIERIVSRGHAKS